MRPVELTFSGLRSYRSTATIDFSALDLFAVIGDTGAGKSTIIEALSLALYGTYTWKGGRIEDLIADGATALSVELRFLADGDEWVVTRSRRRKGGPGVNKLECRARGIKDDGNTAVNERVRSLLGLTHDQFLRAVVMPQGRFDELLRATKADRTNILRSIFGLDDLRLLRERAEALRATWMPVRDEVTGRRKMLPHDPGADLTAARARLATAAAAATRLAAARDAADRTEGYATRLDAAHRRLVESLAAVPAETGDPVAELHALAERSADLASHRRTAEQDRDDAETAVGRVEGEQASLLVGFDRRDDAAAVATRLRTAADRLAEAIEELGRAEAVVVRLRDEAPAGEVPTALLDRARAAEAGSEAATEHLDTARAAASSAARALAELVTATREWQEAEQAIPAAEGAVDACRTALEQAERAVTAAEASTAAAKVAHSDAVRGSAAAAAATGCGPGDPCPICHRDLPHGFVPPASPAVESAAVAVSMAEDELADRRAARVRAATALERAETALTEARAACAEALAERDRCRGQASAAGVALDASDEVGALAGVTAAVLDAEHAATVAGHEVLAAREAVTKAATTLEVLTAQHRKDVADATERVETAQGAVDAQRRVRDTLPEPWRPDATADPDALRDVAGRIEEASDRHAELDGQIVDARARRQEAVTTLAALQLELARSVAEPANRLAERVRARHERVADVGRVLTATAEVFDGAPEPPAAAVVVPAPGSEPAELVDVVAELLLADAAVCAEAATRADEAERRSATAAADLERILAESGCADLASVRHEAGVAANAATNAEQAVADAEGAAEQAAALDRVLAVAGPFVANLEVLRTTLSDTNFVNHLVGLREAELLAEATRRLKRITAGRYGFVADFGIVDIASGEVRTPDSLSGGERFQAALALALALVEIASRGTGRLEAVFVDEGFGSLDATALDVALDTLGTVAGGGKMVALISHLRPVAEYVDTVLHVRKDDAFGSSISVLTGEERDRFLDDEIRAGLTS